MKPAELKEQDIRLARETLEAVNRKRARNCRRPVELRDEELQIVAQAIADARETGWRCAVDRINQRSQ